METLSLQRLEISVQRAGAERRNLQILFACSGTRLMPSERLYRGFDRLRNLRNRDRWPSFDGGNRCGFRMGWPRWSIALLDRRLNFDGLRDLRSRDRWPSFDGGNTCGFRMGWLRWSIVLLGRRLSFDRLCNLGSGGDRWTGLDGRNGYRLHNRRTRGGNLSWL